MRARGLKRYIPVYTMLVDRVAPHAGAWIETIFCVNNWILMDVAPHAGAWIETPDHTGFYFDSPVAPHAGAWIETSDPQAG